MDMTANAAKKVKQQLVKVFDNLATLMTSATIYEDKRVLGKQDSDYKKFSRKLTENSSIATVNEQTRRLNIRENRHETASVESDWEECLL